MIVPIELVQSDGRSTMFRDLDSLPAVGDVIDVDGLGTKARVTDVYGDRDPKSVRAELLEDEA
jgi:hypothetical protein